MSKIDMLILMLILPLVLIQGILIFRDAIKNKIPNPWLWGIMGSIQTPCPLIIYLIYRRVYLKKNNIKK